MITISTLAKESGLSRTALLYYDRLGLLKPSKRDRNGYRLYAPDARSRLKQLCLYREMGIPLRELKLLLDVPEARLPEGILRRRLRALDHEIAMLRGQQSSILRLLKQTPFQQGAEMINKDRWIEIMRAAGFGDDDMKNWHRQFEKMEPEAHREFLESLGIPGEEVTQIREWSRKA